MSRFVEYGMYECQRCNKDYMVNDQWKPCTPYFCHNCTEHLEKQYALVPVDKNGKDVVQ